MSACRKQPLALSITTRGIGLSTCNLCHISAAGANVSPPLYAMYRAFLGLLEAKLASIRLHYFFIDNTYSNSYDCQSKLRPILKMAQSIIIVPEPIKRIIDAVDVITHNEKEYMPVVAAQLKDEGGRVIPRPENLLLSNLRAVVVALSSEETPMEYRAVFKDNCPIPGAIWKNNVLLNADEIIPETYNLEEGIRHDILRLQTYLTRMRKDFSNIANGVLSGIQVATKLVSKAALVSSDMRKLCAMPRLEGESLTEYCQKCPVQGDTASYRELEQISDYERLQGQLALLGEYPNVEVLRELAAPVLGLYSLRDFTVGGQWVLGSYLDALIVSNAVLFRGIPSIPARSRENSSRKKRKKKKTATKRDWQGKEI